MNWNDVPEIEEITQIGLDQFLSELQIISSDIPDDMLKFYLRKAIRDFSKRSNNLLRKVKIHLQPCVKEYPICLPEGEEFNSLQRPRDRQREVGCYTECGRYYVSWSVPLQKFVVGRPDPKTTTDVYVMVSTTLNKEACVVDSAFMNAYYDDIIHGAKAELFALNGENVTWTNLKLADYHNKAFSERITAAGLKRLLGGSTGTVALKPRRTM